MKFPVLVYICPGIHKCEGNTFSTKHATSQKEFTELLKDGYYATLPEAMGTIIDSPATRAEMEVKAKELGIGFNRKTKDKTLMNKIDEAINGVD